MRSACNQSQSTTTSSRSIVFGRKLMTSAADADG